MTNKNIWTWVWLVWGRSLFAIQRSLMLYIKLNFVISDWLPLLSRDDYNILRPCGLIFSQIFDHTFLVYWASSKITNEFLIAWSWWDAPLWQSRWCCKFKLNGNLWVWVVIGRYLSNLKLFKIIIDKLNCTAFQSPVVSIQSGDATAEHASQRKGVHLSKMLTAQMNAFAWAFTVLYHKVCPVRPKSPSVRVNCMNALSIFRLWRNNENETISWWYIGSSHSEEPHQQ